MAVVSVSATILGRALVDGIIQQVITNTTGFPPSGPTGITKTIPSYLYLQYNDDANLQSFVDAYNAYTQAYVDWFNTIELPVYTNGSISGPLLDWVGWGLYGMKRPALPSHGRPALGPYNTFMFNQLPYNGSTLPVGQGFYLTSDDIYKRILTWHFYKSDGRQFNIAWLKRRLKRFLKGVNGTDLVPGDDTYNVSIDITGPDAATITLPNNPTAVILQTALNAGVCELPIQITWTINT